MTMMSDAEVMLVCMFDAALAVGFLEYIRYYMRRRLERLAEADRLFKLELDRRAERRIIELEIQEHNKRNQR